MTYTLSESPSHASWQVHRDGQLVAVLSEKVDAERYIAEREAIPVRKVERAGLFVCTSDVIDAGSGPVE